MTPEEDFAERCHALLRRGVSAPVLDKVYVAGDFGLLAQVEALNSERIAALNAAALK